MSGVSVVVVVLFFASDFNRMENAIFTHFCAFGQAALQFDMLTNVMLSSLKIKTYTCDLI